MSRRYYCDLCDKPAVDGLHGTQISVPVGTPVSEYRTRADGSGCVGNYQTLAVASVHFSFTDHKTGFGGPPDLCAECAAKLVEELRQKIAAKGGQS